MIMHKWALLMLKYMTTWLKQLFNGWINQSWFLDTLIISNKDKIQKAGNQYGIQVEHFDIASSA